MLIKGLLIKGSKPVCKQNQWTTFLNEEKLNTRRRPTFIFIDFGVFQKDATGWMISSCPIFHPLLHTFLIVSNAWWMDTSRMVGMPPAPRSPLSLGAHCIGFYLIKHPTTNHWHDCKWKIARGNVSLIFDRSNYREKESSTLIFNENYQMRNPNIIFDGFQIYSGPLEHISNTQIWRSKFRWLSSSFKTYKNSSENKKRLQMKEYMLKLIHDLESTYTINQPLSDESRLQYASAFYQSLATERYSVILTVRCET